MRHKSRAQLLQRGLILAQISVLWNVAEGVVSIAAGAAAGSVALLGFGIDSFVETTSAAVLIWRLRIELRGLPDAHVEKVEVRASKCAGALLLILAIYVLIDAGMRLLGYGGEAHESLLGIGITAVSLTAMPLLGRAKLKIAGALGSRALRADAYETITCAWLSFTTLSGLLLNALFGWWWADPVAALLLVPLIVREGVEGLRGGCACACAKPDPAAPEDRCP